MVSQTKLRYRSLFPDLSGHSASLISFGCGAGVSGRTCFISSEPSRRANLQGSPHLLQEELGVHL